MAEAVREAADGQCPAEAVKKKTRPQTILRNPAIMSHSGYFINTS